MECTQEGAQGGRHEEGGEGPPPGTRRRRSGGGRTVRRGDHPRQQSGRVRSPERAPRGDYVARGASDAGEGQRGGGQSAECGEGRAKYRPELVPTELVDG